MPEMARRSFLLFKGNIIYGLVDSRTELIRYIGQTRDLVIRLAQHRQDIKNPKTHKGFWLRQLHSENMTFRVVLLQKLETPEELDSAEVSWIAYGHSAGWQLTNATAGGGFCKLTAEARQKISAKAIARGPRKQSDEERERRSMRKRGKLVCPAGYKHTVETKAKIASARRKRGGVRFKGDRPKLRINLLGGF